VYQEEAFQANIRTLARERGIAFEVRPASSEDSSLVAFLVAFEMEKSPSFDFHMHSKLDRDKEVDLEAGQLVEMVHLVVAAAEAAVVCLAVCQDC
jgi:hypothetical protein